MFKKSLLAAALTTAAMGANAAATSVMSADGLGQTVNGSNNGAVLVSAEGAVGATTFDVSAKTLTFTVGTNKLALYTSANKIRVTLSGATFSPATSLDADVNDTDGTDGKDPSFDLVGGTGASVVYTSGSVLEMAYAGDAKDFAEDDTITVKGLVLTPESVASGARVIATLEVLSSVGGSVIDTATADLTNVVTQYSAKVSSKFSKTIDVTADRKKFTDGTSNESLTIEIKSKQVDLLAADATTSGNKGSATVYGDFSYLDSDGDDKLDSGVTVKAGSADATFAKGFGSFTFKTAADLTGDGAAADTDTQTVTITGDNKRVMKSQDFTADISFAYKDAKSTAQSYKLEGTSAGSWGLNGTSVNVPYLPVGFESLSANLEISNSSTVDAEISIDAFDNEGMKYDSVKLTKVAGKKSVTKLSEQEIVDALGITGSAKLSLNVTVNSPNGISIYPYYRENDVRVTLPTSQYRAVQCKASGTISTAETDSGTATTRDGAGTGSEEQIYGNTTGTISTTCTKDFN